MNKGDNGVFAISSTFKDMQTERDYLRSHVFPRLEEKLRKRPRAGSGTCR